MTTFSETLNWSGNCSVTVEESAPDWVNRRYPKTGEADISFDFSPQGPAKVWFIGATSYNAGYKTEINEPITFTATCVFVNGESAIEYYWDFGDGYQGWGNPVTHTFSYASERLRVTLRVTDSNGNRYYVGKQLYVEQSTVQGIVIETDEALPATPAQIISAGQASETDTALAATVG